MAEPTIDWQYDWDEEGYRFRKYYCTEDGKVLWVQYMHNDVEIVTGECKHFKWISVGNGCYPDPIDEQICAGIDDLVKESLKRIEESTTTYFLVPTSTNS